MKTYQFKPTSNPKLFRVVDLEGDWIHYFFEEKKGESGVFLRAVNYILDSGYAKGSRFYEYLKNQTPENADRILKAAGERGDRVHQAISKILETGKADRSMKVLAEDDKTQVELSNDEWGCLLAFAEFWKRHKPIGVAKEESVYNVSVGYAGTFDCIAILTQNCGVKMCGCNEFIGKPVLFDWKTSSGIYESYGAQVAAYAKADNLPIKVEATAIVRIGTSHKTTGGYEVRFYGQEETEKHYAEFLSALTIANATYKPFSTDEIVDIPDQVEIPIEIYKIPKAKKPTKRSPKKPKAQKNA